MTRSPLLRRSDVPASSGLQKLADDQILYVLAASRSQIYEFDRQGRLLWSKPIDRACLFECTPSLMAISKTSQIFVAGDSNGKLFMGNASGPYRQIEVNGQVESVAISDSGNVSAAIISRDSPNGSTTRLVYLVNDKGRLLGNYSFIAPNQATGGSRVAIAGNGCCIIAALESDGIYYFVRSESQTTTTQTSGTTSEKPGISQLLTMATMVLIGGGGLVALLFIIRRRSRFKANRVT